MSKIEDQFHYFNIKGSVDSVYGNWAVSEYGDVVNYLYPYVIPKIHLNELNWIDKLRKKIWFKEDCEKDLENAIARAQNICQR